VSESENGKLIAIRGLHRVYQVGIDEVHALNGVDLDIAAGEYVAIMGPSGSGKTTLMNILGCLDTPTGGSYRLKDAEIAKMTDDELARIRNQEIGFVFQTFNLLPRADALHNVELPLIYAGMSAKSRRERAAHALERVGLGNRMDHKPNELSGGQQQRAAVARALVNQPIVLLADEPTGNLDSKTAKEILDLFDELHAQGRTILLVTHDPGVATRAEWILRVLDGRVNKVERGGRAVAGAGA
jgi:putative ABC transport system ATP-binding protein